MASFKDVFRVSGLMTGIVISVTPVILQAQFQVPDTVCVNAPVTVSNTITTASSYYWSFCQADINVAPVGKSLGNVNSTLSVPATIDYGYENGKYYGILVNNSPGGLVRLDFGNSLLNTPTATALGNFSGSIPDGAEGVQVVKENNKWYAIIVGGDPGAQSTPRIVKVDFGASLANTPAVTNWGNLGNMAYPHDIYVFKDAGSWYGFVANYRNNTITRFHFGSDFSNVPVATNLGNLGSLSGPTGLCPINDNGVWRLFVTNFSGNTISRIDFGNSLLNAPSAAVNLGNLGNSFSNPRDIMILNYCSQPVAFVGNDNSDLVRLNFSSLGSTPSYQNMGKIGGPGNIHSISKLFREGADVFVFLPNSYSNNLTRLRFMGCTDSNIAGSVLQTPAPFSYNSPGIYNISLTTDDGLPTQNTYCKQVVVIAKKSLSVSQDTSICTGSSVNLQATGGDSYEWLNTSEIPAATLASAAVTPQQNTSYRVVVRNHTCKTSDTLVSTVKVNPLPVVRITKSNDINCSYNTARLSASGAASYQWLPVTGLSDPAIADPVVSIQQSTKYYLTAASNAGCVRQDSVEVLVTAMNTAGDNYLVPTAFTPNGDGINDCFGIKQWGNLDNIAFSIYNRWGERIFYSNTSTRCWDGRYKSIPQPSGTYVYHISFQSFCGTVERKGTLVLIR